LRVFRKHVKCSATFCVFVLFSFLSHHLSLFSFFYSVSLFQVFDLVVRRLRFGIITFNRELNFFRFFFRMVGLFCGGSLCNIGKDIISVESGFEMGIVGKL